MTRWEPYLWPQTPAATDAELDAVARAWGAAPPAAFLDVARRHHGESPEPGSLRVGGVPRTVECLLALRTAGVPASWTLVGVDAELGDRLPAGVHPVAATTSGTFFGLDADGAVVHLDLDADPDDEPGEAVRVVAGDFTAFLARLGDAAGPT